jgi:hypothetical protein
MTTSFTQAAIACVIAVCVLVMDLAPAQADCPQPGTETYTEESIDFIVAQFSNTVDRICCCFTNAQVGGELSQGEPQQGFCCGQEDANCETIDFLTSYDLIPVVHSGSWNIDDDHDGNWDYDTVPLVTAQVICFCDGYPPVYCFQNPIVLTTGKIFSCGSCNTKTDPGA